MKYLWILEKHSGKPLFFYQSAELPIDENILSGLLSALNSVSEIELKTHGIENIDMGGLRWVYVDSPKENLLLISADTKDSNAGLMHARLAIIRKMFIAAYGIDDEFWSQGIIDISQFKNFKDTINTLRDQWAQAAGMMDVGVLFDILGVFQQIFIQLIKIVNTHIPKEHLDHVLGNLALIGVKVENWLTQQSNKESYRVIEPFIPRVDLPNLRFVFNEATGTNIFGLNPVGLNQEVFRPIFLMVVRDFQENIEHCIGECAWLTIVKHEIYPFLLHRWDMLASMNLTKELIQIIMK